MTAAVRTFFSSAEGPRNHEQCGGMKALVRVPLSITELPGHDAPVPPVQTAADNLAEADVPSVDAYENALIACKPALRMDRGYSVVLEMLRAHERAADMTVTTADLATEVGLPDYKSVNLRYGAYAKALCKELGITPKHQFAILATFEEPDDGLARLKMLPQVAKAMRAIGWLGRPSS